MLLLMLMLYTLLIFMSTYEAKTFNVNNDHCADYIIPQFVGTILVLWNQMYFMSWHMTCDKFLHNMWHEKLLCISWHPYRGLGIINTNVPNYKGM